MNRIASLRLHGPLVCHVCSLTARTLLIAVLGHCSISTGQSAEPERLVPAKAAGSLRMATYNVSLNRSTAGKLTEDLESSSAQARALAVVIRAVQPDILLLNEVDYSTSSSNAELFQSKYLSDEAEDALGNTAWPMPHSFSAPVNTGEPSGLDLNSNQRSTDPEDAWGFGLFPGQYGMAVLSRYPLDASSARTFQKFKWAALPGGLQPRDPVTGAPYYDKSTWQELRLSSKSFWDVPVATPLGMLHVLASHPTPPAFDGPEDRNGCRNHDEIKLIQLYIESAAELVDDRGTRGGLAEHDSFVVLGDLNSDPRDGGSQPAAINELLRHPRIAPYPAPRSLGAMAAAIAQGGANQSHVGDSSEDTGDFNDRSVGNLRIDYVLPSANFQVVAAGVFWPELEQIAPPLRAAVQESLDATDHHLVWVDVQEK